MQLFAQAQSGRSSARAWNWKVAVAASLVGSALLACGASGSRVGKVAVAAKSEPRPSALPPPRGNLTREPAPRLIAYVNCLCGFGVGSSNDACLDQPDPTINHVKQWEEQGVSPISHYVLAFLAFEGNAMATDRTSVWANGGGSTTDFELDDTLKDAMRVAQAHGKQVVLSLGGELGSARFPGFWRALGATSEARVANMRLALESVARRFAQQNGVRVDGFDIDLELGGLYAYGSDKYVATRDLINAVPDAYSVAFAPQISNGLCAAPVTGDALGAATVLGGDCGVDEGDATRAWVLTRLDQDCKRADGGPKLEYFGIQYYNAGEDACCGGGHDADAMLRSTVQSYVNLSEGWSASPVNMNANASRDSASRYTWPAFAGLGAERVVLGKPGCRGCATSNYLDLASMRRLLADLDHKLSKPMGGVFFWDLCRMLGKAGGLCGAGGCQPSWGGNDILHNLEALRLQISKLHVLH